MSNKELTKTVRVVISYKDLLDFFGEALYLEARTSEDKERSFYYALGFLVGVSDVQAVKMANRKARKQGLESITTDEFRKWLPKVFSRFAEKAIGKTKSVR